MYKSTNIKSAVGVFFGSWELGRLKGNSVVSQVLTQLAHGGAPNFFYPNYETQFWIFYFVGGGDKFPKHYCISQNLYVGTDKR